MDNGILADKTILIFGIRNEWSIAWGIARSLLANGANLILCCESNKIAKKVTRFTKEFGEIPVYCCDVLDDNNIQYLQGEIAAKHEIIHGLVHSIAKGFDLDKSLSYISRMSFQLTNEISVFSFITLTRTFFPLMKSGGSIITMTYIGAERAVPNYNIMGVSKAGLEASIRYLALELGQFNIRVNGISAGPLKTTSSKGTKEINKLLNIVKSKSPLHKNTELSEIGDTAAFLLSSLSRGITGNIIYVDSGYHIVTD